MTNRENEADTAATARRPHMKNVIASVLLLCAGITMLVVAVHIIRGPFDAWLNTVVLANGAGIVGLLIIRSRP